MPWLRSPESPDTGIAIVSSSGRSATTSTVCRPSWWWAQTFAETEPITDVGARLGWTVVSMARDWDVVFPTVS
jgi:hypothetical protein